VNCCENSFSASPGWDAVTGLGSPNFQIIANLVINNATAFANLGSYPVGGGPADTPASITYQTVVSDDGSDDSAAQKKVGISALAISVVGFALAGVALGVGIFAMRKATAAGPMSSSH
jgi:hypothetical protein